MASEEKKSKKKWIIIAVVAVLIIAAIAAGGGNDQAAPESSQPAAEQQAPAKKPEKEKFEISDVEVSTANGLYTISGKLTNNSGKDTSYVQVIYDLYDKEGTKVGQALANTNNIKDGKAWKFDATALDAKPAEVDSYELSEVTGF